MCEQCLTNAVVLVKDIIPGFTLMQATRDGNKWKDGQYGLVEINDPSVILTGPLVADPTHGMTDDAINALASEVYESSFETYDAAMDRLGDDLRRDVDPLTTYRLVKSCIEAGYDRENDGLLEHWLLHTLATKANGAVPVSNHAHIEEDERQMYVAHLEQKAFGPNVEKPSTLTPDIDEREILIHELNRRSLSQRPDDAMKPNGGL